MASKKHVQLIGILCAGLAIVFGIEALGGSKGTDPTLSSLAAGPAASTSNGQIEVIVNSRGQFTLRRATDGAWLIYPQSGTSYLSVWVDGAVYTNEENGGLTVTDGPTQDGVARIRTWYRTPESIVVLLQIELLGEVARVTVTVSNAGTQARNVSLRWLIDTQVGPNDGAPLYAPAVGYRVYETEVAAGTFTEGVPRMCGPTQLLRL